MKNQNVNGLRMYIFFCDGEIADVSEEDKIAEHNESCQQCKEMLVEFRKIRSALRQSEENSAVENNKFSLRNNYFKIEFRI